MAERYQKELFHFLSYIISRNGLVELRLFGEKYPYKGFFRDPQVAYRALLPVTRGHAGYIPRDSYPRDGEARAVYFTLNSFRPDLEALSSGKVTIAGKDTTTSDRDVTCVRMILIDCDPLRDPKDISSTRGEKHAAAGVVRRVRRFLKKHGVSSIPADSGNGFHLLVPVRYDDVSYATAHTIALLSYLKKNFATPQVSVDTTVSNASRISKLYGTMVKKGDSIPDRPHRRSALHMRRWMVELPDQPIFQLLFDTGVIPVAEILTSAPAAESTATATATGDTPAAKRAFHIENIQHILAATATVFREDDKGDRHIFEFHTCPVHTDYDKHEYECCVMVESDGHYSAKCQHDDTRTWKDFKEAIHFDEHKLVQVQDIIAVLGGTEAVEKKLEERRVIPIGYYDNNVMFFGEDSKQYISFNVSDINISWLCSDWSWWQAYCPDAFEYKNKKLVLKKNGMIILKESLIADVKATGKRIDYLERRETGVYRDRNRIIFNAGNKVFVNGEEVGYLQIDSDYLYQASNPIPLFGNASTTDDFHTAISLLQRTTIENHTDVWLFLCTMLSGVVSGMSPWRSHLWICGPKGSGKSDMVDLVIDPFVKAIGGVRKEGNLSEAAIRQSISKRCTIFLHDEAENNDHIANELALIRTSSHGGDIAKGTPQGRMLNFRAMSSFILLSISDSVTSEADRERFININLRHTGTSAEEWTELRCDLQKFFTQEMACKFVLRMVQKAEYYNDLFHQVRDMFIAYVKATRKETTASLSRIADLYTSPITVFTLMTTDDIGDVNYGYIEEMFKYLDKAGRLGDTDKDTADDEGNMSVALFNQMLDTVIPVRIDSTIFNKRIRDVLNDDPMDTEKECLRAYGIYYLHDKRVIKLKNKNQYLLDIFKKFNYINYRKVLLGVPGASVGTDINRYGEHFRGIEIPYNISTIAVTTGTSNTAATAQTAPAPVTIKNDTLPSTDGSVCSNSVIDLTDLI